MLLHLILLCVVQISRAQRYDPLFKDNEDCNTGNFTGNATECGQGFFADFRDPDNAYQDVVTKKWSMIGWVDSAIESFASTNADAARCLNESLVTGFVRICQGDDVWGFIGCAHIPCYAGNSTVHLGGCMNSTTVPLSKSWPGEPTYNVRALNVTTDTLSCP